MATVRMGRPSVVRLDDLLVVVEATLDEKPPVVLCIGLTTGFSGTTFGQTVGCGSYCLWTISL